jgi:cell fate regulator YaaT (PSP1 superfamily)
MSCSNCSSGGGTPRGCQNNGNCSSGGCNKLEVYDWLANMALPSNQAPYDIVEVRFKNSRKNFYRNSKSISLQVGDVVVAEETSGYDIGVISIVGELARIQVKKKETNFKPLEAKKIHRIATQEDIDKWIKARSLESGLMQRSRTMAIELALEMKISDVEYQGDLTKATFYYTAEGRVDFRQLIKNMAEEFKVRIEMRQIGSRQEASRLGGIGSCGRELCCSTWLTDFRSVSTSAARYQQLSLNPQKLAGQCGKLKCCLNYELDMYIDSMKSFPIAEVRLKTEKASAYHIKTDVFKRQMWYAYEGDSASGLIALTPERVKEIIELNIAGKKPKELLEYAAPVVEKEPDYSNVVGQDSLSRFENSFKKKKNKPKPNNGPKGDFKPNPRQNKPTDAIADPSKPAKVIHKPNPHPKKVQQQNQAQVQAQPKPVQPKPAQPVVLGENGEPIKPKSNNKKRRFNKNKPKPTNPINNENNA